MAGAVGLVFAGAQVSTANELDLDISLIIDAVYFNTLSTGNESPAGFSSGHHHHGHSHDHGHGHSHGFDEGFNMGHSEISIEGTLGGALKGVLMLGFNDKEVEVEEAYLQTLGLPNGLQLKAGKFLSGIGYINSQHGHDWDFVDRPLLNEYLFGDHGLQETGIQATWLAPTDTYTLFGLELLQGETSGVANYIGSQGDGRILKDVSGPRLVTGFVKFAPDLGDANAAQFGLSGGYARSYQNTREHSLRNEDWDGTAWFAGVDGVFKHDAGRSYGHGDWRLQGEYFYRAQDVDRRDVAFEGSAVSNVQSFTNKQDGLYIQGVYGIAPRWEAGLRAEALGFTNKVGRGDGKTEDTSYRYSAQLTFRPMEPVFLRAQLSSIDFADDDHSHGNGLEFMLQLNVALGAHGAHRF
ncbi:zinc-regulated TonB-dependent outer membrane receptor [Ectothiorhodosinus mongolicus]|nr:zinc-regulated TonB-dependent outer membrane receptor [Ectothiorhodosinus mongolicus]